MKITDKINLYNCDCMPFMKDLPDEYYDLAIVDPPYGDPAKDTSRGQRFGGMFKKYKDKGTYVKRTGGTWAAKYGKKIIGWDSAPDKSYFDELFRISKNQIIWGGNYFALPPTRCFLVWKKPIAENFSMAMAEYAWTSFSSNAKVFEGTSHTGKEKRFHPTQKPVKLYEWILRNYAKPTDRILDTHAGSCSLAIACDEFGCSLDACEIDKDYFDKAVERLKEFTAQGKLF